jgi:mono/diheme cytochrome c family protein
MRLSLETRALGWATLAALLSLGGAGLLAGAIRMTAGSSGGAALTDAVATSPAVSSAPEVVSKGHEFFEMSCSHCHGDDAHGDEGPDLHNLSISNARIAATIRTGIKGEMPTFAKKYDGSQVAALVSYLRTLH